MLNLWKYIQSYFDLSGDCIMCLFTAAIIWKVLHGGINMADAGAYGSAVATFGYSNTHNGPKQS